MNDYSALCEKMKVINYNLGELINDIDNLKDVLTNNFCVDDKIIHSDEIELIRSDVRELKISSKNDIIEDLINNV